MNEIFKDILNDPKIFNRDGKVQACIFKKYPEVIKYCEEMLKMHPEYEKPIIYFAYASRGMSLNKCIVCGKMLNYTKHINKVSCCCKKCANTYRHEQVKKAMVEKYGVECCWYNKEVREKCQNTMIEKYSCHSSSLPEVKEKMKRTFMERYGTTCSLYNKEVAAKVRQTIKEKYGLDCSPNSLGGKINSIKHTHEKRRKKFEEFNEILKQNNLTQLEEYIGKNDGTTSRRYTFKCNKCGNVFEDYFSPPRHYPVCKVCNPKNWQSCQYENKLHQFLNHLNVEFTTNTRSVIPPYELDIFIPSKNVAIEIDGLYWHSDAKIKDKNYHLMKQNLCKDKNIKLIHIFEDEIRDKEKIVYSKIKDFLGIKKIISNETNLCVKEIDFITANKFAEKYDINGCCKKSSLNLGLFYKNRICAVMMFVKHNKNFEIIRYCTLFNFIVKDSIKLILNYFENKDAESFILKIDKRWDNSELYKQSGFKELNESKPSYWAVKNKDRFIPNNVINYKYGIWDCGYKNLVLPDEE